MSQHATAIVIGLSVFGVAMLSGVAIFWEDITTWWITRRWPSHLIRVYISETRTSAHIEVEHKNHFSINDLRFNDPTWYVVTPFLGDDVIERTLGTIDYCLCWNLKSAYEASDSLKRVMSLLPLDTISVLTIDEYALQLMVDTNKKIRCVDTVYDDPFQLQEAILDMQREGDDAMWNALTELRCLACADN